MKKSWGLIPKILAGRKKIESRWGKVKCAPWGRVAVGDCVYFKNSGEKVVVKASVSKVAQFEGLTPVKVRKLLQKYGGKDGIFVSNVEETYNWAKDKRYCSLIYLTNPQKVRPFAVDKKGFGVGAAWLCVDNITRIKIA